MIILVSCAYNWTWKPDPYAADHITESIYGSGGETVRCSDPEFDKYTCFHYDNIEDLKKEIEKMKEFCK